MLETGTPLQFAFYDRDTIGTYLNGLNLLGVGVEIGTHRGEFANKILSKWRGKFLFCIDPWILGYSNRDCISLQNSRNEDKLTAMRTLSRYHRRCGVMETTSEEACKIFRDGALDFVYVDGNHEPEAVQQDINLWWPKIKPGGRLFGHDYICPGEVKGGWGQTVQPIVHRFADSIGISVFLIPETKSLPWSFVLEKP